jgi:hypothetical protein
MATGARRGTTFPQTKGDDNPNYSNPLAVAHSDYNNLVNYFGTAKGGVKPEDLQHITAETLAQAFAGKNGLTTERIHEHYEDGRGWWTAFAPVRVMEMNEVTTIDTWDSATMVLSPEDAAPQLITHREESHVFTMSRYALGAKFRMDFFKTARGQKVYSGAVKTLVSSSWIAAKIQTGYAALDSTQTLLINERGSGRAYNDLLDATTIERDGFGILNKSPKGIYRLNTRADAIADSSKKVWDMVVLTSGTLDLLAQSGFHTEAFRVGEAKASLALSLGGKSLQGIFPGKVIYEDAIWRLANTTEDDIRQFRTRSQVGEWYFNYGTSQYDSDDVQAALSIMIPSMDQDGYKLQQIKKLINVSTRFTDDGELGPYTKLMLQNLPSILQRAGLKDVDQMIDPYVYKTDASSNRDKQDKLHGYAIIENYGDADIRYFTVDQNIKHGKASKRLFEKEGVVTQQDVLNIKNLQTLVDSLYNLDDISDESMQGYFAAIAVNPENAVTPGDNSSFFLKSNQFGSVMPPYVEVTPSNQVSDVNPPTKLYVLDPRDMTRKLYIYAVRSDVKADIARDYGGSANARNVATPGQTWSFFLSEKMFDDALPAADRLAAINAGIDVGAPSDDHTARGNNYIYANRAAVNSYKYYSTTAKRGTETPTDVGLGATDVQGYGIPLHVQAPKRPYAFGNIAGIRTLAQMYINNDSRGWDENILKTAAEGVRSLDLYFTVLKQHYPLCKWTDPNFVPTYMKTGDSDMDSMNAAINNLWDHVKYPLMIRVPSALSDAAGNIGIEVMSPGTGVAIGRNAIGFTPAKSRAILHEMGFTFDGTAGSGKNPLVLADSAAAATKLEAVLARPEIDESIKSELLRDGGRELFAFYRDVHSNLGSKFQEDARRIAFRGNMGDLSSFAYLWQSVFQSDASDEKVARAMNGILGLCQARTSARDLTLAQVNKLKESSFPTSRADEEAKRAIAASRTATLGGTRQSSNGLWVNSRLTISEKVWHNIARMLSNTTSAEITEKFYKLIVRPSDPKDQTKPLAGVMASRLTATDTTNIPSIRTSMATEFAYGKAKRSKSLGIFGVTDLLGDSGATTTKRTRDSGSLYGGVPDVDDDLINGLSDYGVGKSRVPNTMFSNAKSPFYETVDYQDKYGRSLQAQADDVVSKKKWLVFRINEIYRLCETDWMVRIPALMLTLTKVHKHSVFTLLDKNLPIPFSCFILFKPHITLAMGAGMWAKGGAETAENGYNYNDAVLQLNGMNKQWHLHYSKWMGTHIYDPSNFVIFRDIRFEGYISGHDDKYYDDPESFEPTNLDYDRSMWAIDCGGNLTIDDIPEVLTTSFKYTDKQFPYNLLNRKDIFSRDQQLLPSGIYTLTTWRLNQINSNTWIDRTTFAKEKNSTWINEAMYQGPQRNWDPVKKAYKKQIKGRGHLGKVVNLIVYFLSFFFSHSSYSWY